MVLLGFRDGSYAAYRQLFGAGQTAHPRRLFRASATRPIELAHSDMRLPPCVNARAGRVDRAAETGVKLPGALA